jgi:hypothetical protein
MPPRQSTYLLHLLHHCNPSSKDWANDAAGAQPLQLVMGGAEQILLSLMPNAQCLSRKEPNTSGAVHVRMLVVTNHVHGAIILQGENACAHQIRS